MISSHFLDRFLIDPQHFLFQGWNISTRQTGNGRTQAIERYKKSPFPRVAINRDISCRRKWSVSSEFPDAFLGGAR